MKGHLISLEPYITVLSDLKLFLDISSNDFETDILRKVIAKKYPGEHLGYIMENITGFKSFAEYVLLFCRSIKEMQDIIFVNRTGRLVNLELFFAISTSINPDLFCINKKRVDGFEPCKSLYKRFNKLKDLHIHGEAAMNFRDSLESIVRGFVMDNIRLSDDLSRLIMALLSFYLLISGKELPCEDITQIVEALKRKTSFPHAGNLYSIKLNLIDRRITVTQFIIRALDILFEPDNEVCKKMAACGLILVWNEIYKQVIIDFKFKGLSDFKNKFDSEIKKALQKSRNRIEEVGEVYKKFLEINQSSEIRLKPDISWKSPFQFFLKIMRENDTVVLSYKKIPIIRAGAYNKKMEDAFRELYRQTKNLVYQMQIMSFRKKEELKKIVGFDVAGIHEIQSPPWLYSTLFKFWRYYGSDYLGYTPGLTFHAGEDFVNIATGLRNIYESIYFLELQRGERLGHALATGIDIERYLYRYYGFTFSVFEYFLHLLWLNHLIQSNERFSRYKIAVREAIEELDREYLNNQINRVFDKKDLLWELYVFYSYLGVDYINTYGHIEFDKKWKSASYSNVDTNRLGDYIDRLRGFFSIYEFQYFRREDKPIKVYPLFPLEFLKIEDQKEFTSQIQNYILEKIIENEIVIEACITSNVLIFNLRSFYDHPVFNKWRDLILKGQLLVTLNTDDPLFLNTNIHREYEIVKMVAPELIPVLRDNAHKYWFGNAIN